VSTPKVDTNAAVASFAASAAKWTATKRPPSRCRNQSRVPSTTIGASVAAAPGTIEPSKRSASGVLSGESASVVAVDSRPELTKRRANGCASASESTASRKMRLISVFGVRKSALRVECAMFSSAACSRSVAYVSSRRSGAAPVNT
jgi:hypothetical protein